MRRKAFGHHWVSEQKRRTLIWEEFSGLNLVDSGVSLSKGAVAFAQNVDFGLKHGAAVKSPGTDLVLDGLGGSAITGIFVATINNKQHLLASCGNKLYAAKGGQQLFFVDTREQWERGIEENIAYTDDGKIKQKTLGEQGVWTSPSFYVGSIPYDADLDWFAVIPDGCSLACEYAVSEDGSEWSDWVGHQQGYSLEFIGQYIKVRFILNGDNDELCVSRFSLRTIGEFGDPQVVYEGMSGYRVRFTEYRDHVYFCDGGPPCVFNGDTVRPLGVSPPEQKPTLTEGGSGDLTGTYRGCVTFVNADGVESNPSPESEAITIEGKKIKWDIPTGGDDIIKRRLYRTKKDGSSFYLVTTIDNNTDTVYEDNRKDELLVTAMADDNNPPPEATIIWAYNDVMFYVNAADPTELWYSKPGAPEHVPNTSSKQFYKRFPAPITMVRAPVAGTMVVSGTGFTAVIMGNIFHSDPSIDNTDIKYVGSMGALNHEAAAITYAERLPISIAMITETLDLYMFSPTVLREDVFSVTPLSRDIAPLLRSVNKRSDVIMSYSGQRLYVGVYLPDIRFTNDVSGANNLLLTFDTRSRKWQGTRPIAASALFSIPQGIYAGLSTCGRVVRFLNLDEEFLWGDRWGEFWGQVPTSIVGCDDVLPAKMLLDTGYQTTGLDKARYRFLRLIVSGDSDTAETKVIVVVDGVEQEIAVGPISGWNLNENFKLGYGLGRQDAIVSPRFLINVPPGRFVGVRIEDESANPLIVYGIAIEYEPVFLTV